MDNRTVPEGSLRRSCLSAKTGNACKTPINGNDFENWQYELAKPAWQVFSICLRMAVNMKK